MAASGRSTRVIFLIGVSTFAVGLLPTYASIGVLATLRLVVASGSLAVRDRFGDLLASRGKLECKHPRIPVYSN